MFSEDAPDLVLVDIDPECPGDLLRYTKTTKVWVALLELNDGLDEFG